MLLDINLFSKDIYIHILYIIKRTTCTVTIFFFDMIGRASNGANQRKKEREKKGVFELMQQILPTYKKKLYKKKKVRKGKDLPTSFKMV